MPSCALDKGSTHKECHCSLHIPSLACERTDLPAMWVPGQWPWVGSNMRPHGHSQACPHSLAHPHVCSCALFQLRFGPLLTSFHLPAHCSRGCSLSLILTQPPAGGWETGGVSARAPPHAGGVGGRVCLQPQYSPWGSRKLP